MAAVVNNLTLVDSLTNANWTLAAVGLGDQAFPAKNSRAGLDGFTANLANTGTALVLNDIYTGWVDFGGPTFDISSANQALIFHSKVELATQNALTADADSLHMIAFSGGGTTNFGVWFVDDALNNGYADGTFYPFIMTGTPDSTGGTFDNTDVTGFGFGYKSGRTGGAFTMGAVMDQLLHIDGEVDFSDDDGTATTIDDFVALLAPTSGESFACDLVNAAGSTFEFAFPFKITARNFGNTDASTGYAFRKDDLAYVSVPANFYSMSIIPPASGTQVFTNATMATKGTAFDFTVDGSAAASTLTMTTLLVAGVADVSIVGANTTMTSGVISDPATCQIADGDLEITINGSVAAINWSADLVAGSTITSDSDVDVSFDVGDYSDINIDFTASNNFAVNPTTGSGTYDFTDITSTGTVNFDNDSANATTIDISATLTFTDEGPPTTGGGTLTVSRPIVNDTISAPNLTAGTVQLFNVTTATIVETVTITSGYTKVIVDGTTVTGGDTVRLRWIEQASLPIETTGLIVAGGTTTFLNTPVTDTVHATYGIDGSTVTEYTADFPNVQIDIDDPEFELNRLYAWYKNELETTQGIDEFWDAILAIDTGRLNIKNAIVNLFLDNVNSASAVQKANENIVLFRDDAAYPQVAGTSGGGGLGFYFQGAGVDNKLIAEMYIRGDLNTLKPNTYREDNTQVVNDDFTLQSATVAGGKFKVTRSTT
ncbi:MAG: hypothetical protein V3R25_09125 [Nitrosomonadaceae bacterium]